MKIQIPDEELTQRTITLTWKRWTESSRKVSVKMGALRLFVIGEELDGIADKTGGKKKLKPSK